MGKATFMFGAVTDSVGAAPRFAFKSFVVSSDEGDDEMINLEEL